MSEQNLEQRIAALEKLVFGMAEHAKAVSAIDASLLKTILEVRALNWLTLRLILAAGVVKNDAIRTAINDAIELAVTREDQIAPALQKILDDLNGLPPPAPPES